MAGLHKKLGVWDINSGICFFSPYFPCSTRYTHAWDMLLPWVNWACWPLLCWWEQPLSLHIALTTLEGSKPATEEPLLLIPAPYFSSLNSLIGIGNIIYSVFPYNSLLQLPLCPPPGNINLPLGTDWPGLWEETLAEHEWHLPSHREVLKFLFTPVSLFHCRKHCC